jgi:carboxymethylenebutenolidase
MTDFKQYLLDEFVEDYQEGVISRREALKLIAGIVGNVALASSLLAACAPPAQPAATALPTEAASPATVAPPATAPASVPTAPPTAVPPTAEPAATTAAESTAEPGGEIEARDVQFEGNGTTLLGYWAKPVGGGPYPIVLVCHENRGLTDHIKDVTRRLAQAGYAALAVDLLSRQGGTASTDSSSVPGLLSSMPQDQFVQDFISGLRYAQQQPGVQADRVGMTGFCFGGGVTWRVAVGLPELRAAVPFYGPPPSADEVPAINAAVLAIYAGRDARITSTAAAMETALQQANKTFEKVIYPDTDHAFFNDTGTRYNAQAAQDAWAKLLAWFDRYLKAA